jgi:predicted outer membrane repeat protein
LTKFWLKGGKLVVQNGKLCFTETCPCGTDEGGFTPGDPCAGCQGATPAVLVSNNPAGCGGGGIAGGLTAVLDQANGRWQVDTPGIGGGGGVIWRLAGLTLPVNCAGVVLPYFTAFGPANTFCNFTNSSVELTAQ